MTNKNQVSRRLFVGTTAALGATSVIPAAASAKRVAGANGRVQLGVIGTGNRGSQVTKAFLQHEDVEVVAICDVYDVHLNKAAANLAPKAKKYTDFRKLLDRDDLDAVLIATPDHWHAIQTIMACRSGKDVYVEKPLSVTIHEGRRMVEVAREHNRVVQVGTHRRSSTDWQRALEVIHSGALGDISMCQAYRTNNMAPNGIGKLKPTTPPRGLDWDMWLGPRALRPYQNNITPYKFRWWKDFSSQFGNWGVHYFDIMRWALKEECPRSVCTMGGNYVVDDDRTIPDTAQSIFQFNSGTLALFGTYEGFGLSMLRGGEFEIRGSHGTMYKDATGIHVIPERRGQFQTQDPPGQKMDLDMRASNVQDTVNHTRNFLDCIKSRKKPNADVELGHRATTMSLLANLSLDTGQRLDWDSGNETITNSAQAAQLMHYEYRKPWSLD